MNDKQTAAVLLLAKDKDKLTSAIAESIAILLEGVSNGNPEQALNIFAQVKEQVTEDLLHEIIDDREQYLENFEVGE